MRMKSAQSTTKIIMDSDFSADPTYFLAIVWSLAQYWGEILPKRYVQHLNTALSTYHFPSCKRGVFYIKIATNLVTFVLEP